MPSLFVCPLLAAFSLFFFFLSTNAMAVFGGLAMEEIGFRAFYYFILGEDSRDSELDFFVLGFTPLH